MDKFRSTTKTTPELPIICSDENIFLLGDKDAKITCSIDHANTTPSNKHSEKNEASSTTKITYPLRICFQKDCKQLNSDNDFCNFLVDTSEVGVHTIKLDSPSSESQLFVTYDVIDPATLQITKTSLKPTMRYNDSEILKVVLEKTSFSNPTNISVILDHPLFSEEWSLDEIEGSKELDIRIEGSNLKFGLNDFNLIVSYDDGLGNLHSLDSHTYTRLTNLSFEETIKVFVHSINGRLTKTILNFVGARNHDEKELIANKMNKISFGFVIFFVFIFAYRIFSHRRIRR